MLSVKNFEMLDYNIRISGNKNGKHDYFFNVDEKFFERFVGHDITKAQIEIIATLWNNNDKLKLSLNINGFIYGLLCDLCASEIDVKISNSLSVLLQFSQEKIEDTDEIMYVQTNQNKIDISHLIYEGVILSIPTTIKHLNKSECKKETILLLKKYSEKDKRTDPRWEQLNKLKDII